MHEVDRPHQDLIIEVMTLRERLEALTTNSQQTVGNSVHQSGSIGLGPELESPYAITRFDAATALVTDYTRFGIWHVDTNGYTLYCNPAMRSLLRIGSDEQITGARWHSFLTTAGLAAMEEMQFVLEQGRQTQCDLEIVPRIGAPRLVSVSIAPIISRSGAIASLVATFSDPDTGVTTGSSGEITGIEITAAAVDMGLYTEISKNQKSTESQSVSRVEIDRHDNSLISVPPDDPQAAVVSSSAIRSFDNSIFESDSSVPYPAFFEASFEAIALVEEGVILDVNPGFIDLFGYDRRDVIGLKIEVIFADEFRDQEKLPFMYATDSVVERTLLRRDGATFLGECRAKFIGLSGCKIIAVVIREIRDISARQSRNPVPTIVPFIAEDRYRMLADLTEDEVSVLDLQGRILHPSSTLAQTTGYNLEELANAEFLMLVHSEDRERVAAEFRRVSEGGPPFQLDWRRVNRDGSFHWVETRAVFAKADEDIVARVLCHTRDIADRKKAESSLRKAQRRLTNILENITDAFVVLDKQGHVSYVNPQAERIMSASRAGLLGRVLWEIYPNSIGSEPYNEYQKALSKQVPVQFESYFPEFQSWLRVRAYPSQEGLTIYMQDVTDRKHAEAELRANIDQVRRSVTGIADAMAFTVEMRDPFTAGHQRRVAVLACAIAGKMGYSAEKAEVIRIAGLLHDIGKIAVPAEILSRPGRLRDAERSIIQTHAQVGYEILKGIEIPPEIALVALQHHERLDGSGYPCGLSETSILPEARIMAVADVVEAMASHRPYRPSLGIEKALAEVLQHRGDLYDAVAVDACLAVFTEHGFDFEQLMRSVDNTLEGENL